MHFCIAHSSLPDFSSPAVGGISGVAVDLKTGKGLVDRHQLDAVDVDMGRLGDNPLDRVGDIVRQQRMNAFVEPSEAC